MLPPARLPPAQPAPPCPAAASGACGRARQPQPPRAAVRESGAAEAERSSLVPQTLAEMAADPEQQALLEQLQRRGQAALSREERRKRQRSLDKAGVPSFYVLCQERGAQRLTRGAATVLQLNIGLFCNQACSHCHVESSPRRQEMMDQPTAERCLALLQQPGCSVRTVDLTGGAPELNSQFRLLVEGARALGLEVIDRCNLTVLLEPGQEDLPAFLAAHRVRVVASLPCYSTGNVDAQRGRGVFERSIRGLQLLNAAGYGRPGSGLALDLVYNPGGGFLAPPQAPLEEAYKAELQAAYGVSFNSLICLNNMPIKRFADHLVRHGELDAYMRLLVDSFSTAAADRVMCRDTVSVQWDGALYDCDFNQQLDMGLRLPAEEGARPSVHSIASLSQLEGLDIACGNHCFGCTAGSGSSCQGALA